MLNEIFKKINKEDYFKSANFHIHSSFSDGLCKFEELIKQADNMGLKYYSITDHNTVLGYKNLKNKPENLITGIEFDCYMDFNLPHILGYGIDVNNEKINKLTSNFKSGFLELPRRILTSRSPKKVIEAIHDAGGIAVLAHPCCYWCMSLDKFVKKLKAMGLDGIETYYPYDRSTRILKFHSTETVIKLADKYDLIKTGGEDQHKSLTSKGKN